MKYDHRRWELAYFKVGTLPGLTYFVAKKDLSKLVVHGCLQIRPDDGVTKPQYQAKMGVVIDDIRVTGNGLLYVAYRM
jgi:hypothetical protein